MNIQNLTLVENMGKVLGKVDVRLNFKDDKLFFWLHTKRDGQVLAHRF